MKTIILTLTIIFAAVGSSLAGSPERARKQAQIYDADYAKWINDVRTAKTNDAQNAAWLRQPDTMRAGLLVWEEIRKNLSDAWVLESAAWLLTNTPDFATRRPRRGEEAPSELIREAVREHHLRSPKIGPYCIALTEVKDPKAMEILEMIEKVNQSPAVRGAAALAQAILHRRVGGGGLGMHLRQEKLRQAIKAPDLTVGKETTQSIAQDELFRMSKLNIGAVAPDFRGIEINQKISSLKDHRGKITVLLFWHALMPSHDQTLEMFRNYQEAFAGKEIDLIGVNMDNPLTLSDHIAEGRVTWKNYSDSSQTISKLYRIETWPYVYVLDEDHKIRYSGQPGAFVKITAAQLAKDAIAKRIAREKARLQNPGE